jgi:hypothetical protein
MSVPPGWLFQLYSIDVDDARPSRSDTVIRIMESEKAFAVSRFEVVEWISQEFDESPTKFLRSSATLLIVEVKYTRS